VTTGVGRADVGLRWIRIGRRLGRVDVRHGGRVDRRRSRGGGGGGSDRRRGRRGGGGGRAIEVLVPQSLFRIGVVVVIPVIVRLLLVCEYALIHNPISHTKC
jgi:hypothetical protein